MYLRHTIRRKDGKVHRYWRLVRSVRVGRRVIQQTVAHLGELDEHGRIEGRALARRLIGTPEQAPLFDDGNEHQTLVLLQDARILPRLLRSAPNFAKATPCLRLRIALSEIERNLGDAYRKVHGKSARIKLRSHTFADFDPAARTGDASSETYTMVRNFRALHNWIN